MVPNWDRCSTKSAVMAVAAVAASYRRSRCASRDNFRSLTPNFEKEIVTINTGGKIFQTYERTLRKFPNTLLGCPEKRTKYFDSAKKQYFFDRHRGVFTAILYYYQSGLLEKPLNIPLRVFMEEVAFFQLNGQPQSEEAVCGKQYENSTEIRVGSEDVPKNALARQIYLLFEQPASSKPARVLAIFSLVIIVLSVVVFCVETLPQLHTEQTSKVFFGLNAACSFWFTLEYLLRFLVCTDKLKFIRGFLNVLDLLSILPFYVMLSVPQEKTGGIAVLRVMRVIRVCRIFKLTRHSKGLHVLGKTLASSMNELLMLSLFLLIGVIVFASAVYYAEGGKQGFTSIPDAFWWAVVTMTTVGYGDAVPKTVIGKCIGALCALSGVLAIALPVPVIVSNFEYFYKTELGAGSKEEVYDSVSLRQLDNLVVKSPFMERKCQEMTRRSPTPDSLKTFDLVPLAVPQTHIKNGDMRISRQSEGKHSRGTSPSVERQYERRPSGLVSEAML